MDSRAEYDKGWRITDAMPVNCAGFITARDHFVMDFDPDAFWLASLISRTQGF